MHGMVKYIPQLELRQSQRGTEMTICMVKYIPQLKRSVKPAR